MDSFYFQQEVFFQLTFNKKQMVWNDLAEITANLAIFWRPVNTTFHIAFKVDNLSEVHNFDQLRDKRRTLVFPWNFFSLKSITNFPSFSKLF